MALSDNQLAQIRVQIGAGTPPTDDDLDDIQARLMATTELAAEDTAPYVAAEVLRARLSDLLNAPSQFSVSGEYSQNTTTNIEALQKQLSSLPNPLLVAAGLDSSSGLSVVREVAVAAPPWGGR